MGISFEFKHLYYIKFKSLGAIFSGDIPLTDRCPLGVIFLNLEILKGEWKKQKKITP